MRVECPNCGGGHPAWDCKRPATKSSDGRAAEPATKARRSTAALKEVRGSAPHQQPTERGAPGLRNLAGTQALPVDTNSEPLLIAAAIPQRMGSSTRKDEGTEAPNPKRPRGRPRIHPDRKAYKAQWERDKRKRLKEGK